MSSRNLGSLWTTYADAVNTTTEDIKDDMELLNLLKGYLVQCAEKVLDNPEELVKEVLKARDEEIKDLKKEVENLKTEIEELKRNSLPLESNPWITTPYYPWTRSSPGLNSDIDITYHASNTNSNEAKG